MLFTNCMYWWILIVSWGSLRPFRTKQSLWRSIGVLLYLYQPTHTPYCICRMLEMSTGENWVEELEKFVFLLCACASKISLAPVRRGGMTCMQTMLDAGYNAWVIDNRGDFTIPDEPILYQLMIMLFQRESCALKKTMYILNVVNEQNQKWLLYPLAQHINADQDPLTVFECIIIRVIMTCTHRPATKQTSPTRTL